MNLHLVIAGNHQQYLRWLAETGRSPAEYQPIDIIGARPVHASSLTTLDQVGTYWDHPMFGGTEYRSLMAAGCSLDLSWAMPWEADFLKAQLLKEGRAVIPVTQAEADAVAEAQAELERLLGA